MKRLLILLPIGLMSAALVPSEPRGAEPTAPVVWESYVGRLDVATNEAPEPPLTALLERAALDMTTSHRGTRIHEFAIAVAAATDDPLTGAWMVALAASETDLQDRWIDGSCNRRGSGMCDHGVAFGPWQMHLDEQGRPGDITGAECLASMPQCAANCLRWLRRAPQVWGSHAAQKARAAEWLRRRK